MEEENYIIGKINEEDIHNEPEQEEFSDLTLLDDETAVGPANDSEEDHDDAEAEERRAKHQILKKQDKIFNSAYVTGDGMQYDDHHSQEIRLSPQHADSYLQEPDGYTDRLGLNVVQAELDEIYKRNPKLIDILAKPNEKKKFTKIDVNFVFGVLVKELNQSIFANSIHVLDAVCNLLQMEYKKAFDMLNYEFKERLIGDLDDQFGVLSSNFKTRGRVKLDDEDEEDEDDLLAEEENIVVESIEEK